MDENHLVPFPWARDMKSNIAKNEKISMFSQFDRETCILCLYQL